MKKLLIGLSLLLSVSAFANKLEHKIEKDLETKYPALTDGTTTIKVHEYDIDIEEKKIKLEVELKEKNSKEMYDKLDKAKVEALAAEMAKYTQEEAKKKVPVEVEIKIDKEIFPNEKVYENTFDR